MAVVHDEFRGMGLSGVSGFVGEGGCLMEGGEKDGCSARGL